MHHYVLISFEQQHASPLAAEERLRPACQQRKPLQQHIRGLLAECLHNGNARQLQGRTCWTMNLAVHAAATVWITGIMMLLGPDAAGKEEQMP